MSRFRKRLLLLAIIGVVGLFLCQTTAFADQVTLTLVGEPTGYTMGGVYTSPYSLQLNNGSVVLALACDDFTTEIWNGVPWTADTYALSQVGNSGPQKFTDSTVTYAGLSGNTVTFASPAVLYDAAALLALQILEPAKPLDSETDGELSFAIWQIFDPTAWMGWNESNPLSTSEITAVNQYMGSALATASATGFIAPDVIIYTPDPKDSAQEFLGVPDGGVTLMLLGGALVGLETLRRRFRV